MRKAQKRHCSPEATSAADDERRVVLTPALARAACAKARAPYTDPLYEGLARVNKHSSKRRPASSAEAPRREPTEPSAVRSGMRRDALVQAATRMFAQKGYSNTSVREIADEVGLLKGSLYYHINEKEDLLFEVIRSTMQMHEDLIRSLRESEAPVMERLHSYVYQSVLGNIVAREGTIVFTRDFQFLSEARQAVIKTMRREHDSLLRDLIHEAMDAGAVAPDIDVKLAALSILTLNGAFYRWYNPTGDLPAEAFAQELTRYHLRGLGADPTALGGSASGTAQDGPGGRNAKARQYRGDGRND